jgi:hypothetical protein
MASCTHPRLKDARMDTNEMIVGKAKGGKARALALTAEERRESAQRAAQARWAAREELPQATHTGELHIGDAVIPCAVLEDGTRLLTQAGFLSALGRSPKPKGRSQRVADGLPPFLNTVSLKDLITQEIIETTVPVLFRTESGSKAHGYRAELLPKVCNLFLDAQDRGKLTKQQEDIATKCQMLIRGLAEVGIVALVDEATGYQEVRDRRALQEILDTYLRKEFAAWAKRFPDEFYFHIARLRGWEWKGRKFNPPQVVAYYTNDFVYHRLAPNLVEELNRRNPVVNGRRRSKNTQWLTEDVGHPALAQHLHAVIALMRASGSWDQLKTMLDAALPKHEGTLRLPWFQNDYKLDVPPKAWSPNESLPLFAHLGDARQE